MELFKLKENGTNVRNEIIGGVTSFLAVAYILAVNPNILCDGTGMDWGAVFTATAISSAIATFIMAFAANLPVTLAPGLGINAFFSYSVVIGMNMPWQFALTAVFVEGLIFVILSLCGVREAIVKSMPDSLKKAVAVGIGLFIAVIGLNNGGILGVKGGTPVFFNEFNVEHMDAILTMIGLVLIVILSILKIPGAFLIAIALTTIIGIPMGITKLPENFTPFSTPTKPYFFEFDWQHILTMKFLVVVFVFLYSDFFDTLGTLMGVAEEGNLKDEEGHIKNVKGALMADAVGTVAGAALGTSTVSSFVESAAGIAAGARTGLANVVTGILFIAALFISPIFALIPSSATACVLIYVGYLLMKSVVKIDFSDMSEGIPAFITIVTMPFAYSIAAGIKFGILSYVLTKTVSGKIKEISVISWILFLVFVIDFFI